MGLGLRRRIRQRRKTNTQHSSMGVSRMAPSRHLERLAAAIFCVFLMITGVGLYGARRGGAPPPPPPRYAKLDAEVWDVLVAGAGPAGLTAALFAARAGLRVAVLGSDAGALAEAPALANFPGWRGADGGEAWLGDAKAQAAGAGAAFAPPGLLAERLRRDGDAWALDHEDGTARARAVVVASGSAPRRLGAAGEAELWGAGVHSCAVCDGSLYAGRTVVVVGGGDAAVDAACLLARHASRVVVVHRRAELRANNAPALAAMDAAANVEVMTPYVVEAWRGQKTLAGAALRHAETGATRDVAADGAFVLIGDVPATAWLAGGPVALSESGHVVLAPGSQATSAAGVFAAGGAHDATYRQAITAAAAGAAAAMDAERWLRSHGAPPKPRAAPPLSESATGPPPPPPVADDCALETVACLRRVVAAHDVVVFHKPRCPYCRKAFEALRRAGAEPRAIDVSRRPGVQDALAAMTGRRTVPNVFIGGASVGGGDETVALRRNGELRPLIDAARAS